MREQALRDGGLEMAFQQQVVAQRKAVIGALKVVYWLVKEEIAYTTKYESLLSLAQSLGCTYLSDLQKNPFSTDFHSSVKATEGIRTEKCCLRISRIAHSIE